MGLRRTVIITGGSSGIGLAAAKKFISEGARVVIAGRDAGRGTHALQSLSAGERAAFIKTDVRYAAECEKLVSDTVDKFGRIDVLVNSAGIYIEQSADSLTEKEYDRIMDTNVRGTMFMSKYALPYLGSTGGNIVNVASDAGLHANYLCSLYSASKGAVVMYTRSLAVETARIGIRVNAVAPGDILTPMTEAQMKSLGERAADVMAEPYPLGRIGTAEEAASVIYFLASDDAAFVTGAVWTVDGGITA